MIEETEDRERVVGGGDGCSKRVVVGESELCGHQPN